MVCLTYDVSLSDMGHREVANGYMAHGVVAPGDSAGDVVDNAYMALIDRVKNGVGGNSIFRHSNVLCPCYPQRNTYFLMI